MSAMDQKWRFRPLRLADGQISQKLSSPFCKNILFFRTPKSALHLLPSCSERGALRGRHERWGGMRWTRGNADERCHSGRRRRVVLTPRCWRQAGGTLRRRRWQTSPVTGESAKKAVKTIVQGRPGISGEPVVTTLVCFIISHARLRVHRAPGFPCALCFQRGKQLSNLGRAAPRGGGSVSVFDAGNWHRAAPMALMQGEG